MYHNFLGIDISKQDFHANLHGEHPVNVYENTEHGFAQFYTSYRSYFSDGLVVLEVTGGYERNLIRYLQERNVDVHRANTRQVKKFIGSYGCLGKSDAIDARGLALYGKERHESLVLFSEPERESLMKLVTRRLDLVSMRTQEKNRLQAPESELTRDSIEAVIAVLNAEVARIEEMIASRIAQDKVLTEQKVILETIPGIADVSSIKLLCLLPELGLVNNKQIASLAGLAPHPNESGKKVGHRFVRGGRKDVKASLFNPAMAASRSDSALGQHYQNLIGRGKKKMVAMTALMRKIVVIANAKIRDYYQEQENLAEHCIELQQAPQADVN